MATQHITRPPWWESLQADAAALQQALADDDLVEVEFRAHMIEARGRARGERDISLLATTLVACCRLEARSAVTDGAARRLLGHLRVRVSDGPL